MTDRRTATHQRVRDIVARDLEPVTPLLGPARRLILLVPIAIAAGVYAPFFYGLRRFDRLGAFASWGVSALEWILGLLILGIALRQAVPGRSVSRRFLIATLAGAPAAIVAVTYFTYLVEPIPIPPGMALQFWYECVRWPVMIGAPLLLAASVLAIRAFPTRPALVGALCGLAAGVLADSGWRLACEVSAPSHVLGSHGLAIALTTAVGSAVSAGTDRLRRRM